MLTLGPVDGTERPGLAAIQLHAPDMNGLVYEKTAQEAFRQNKKRKEAYDLVK